jgi:Protein of unknown function (DUF1168).
MMKKEGTQILVPRTDSVSGSTAGAGSGDFHQYRIQRRRERARLIQMEKEYERVNTNNKCFNCIASRTSRV